jgi:hypothetical protein
MTEEVINGQTVTKCKFKIRMDLFKPPIFFLANILQAESAKESARTHDKPLKGILTE